MNRLSFFIVLLCSIIVMAYFPKEKYVIPKKNRVKIYENRIRRLNESSIFEVNNSSRLRVLYEKKNSFKIQDEEGRIGWVGKRFVVSLKDPTLFKFDPADVIGYIDNPSPVGIFDATDPEETQIKLERSFKEQLKRNVDREMLQRVTNR